MSETLDLHPLALRADKQHPKQSERDVGRTTATVRCTGQSVLAKVLREPPQQRWTGEGLRELRSEASTRRVAGDDPACPQGRV